ncbi:MAG: CDGSH iron-sulfur domain-containing protein [Nitrospinae bacterium]|nr:CDGSH iron-sulfur domain-containing protein [Nitrospinota bacterium]
MAGEPVVVKKNPLVLHMEPGVYWWCACGRSANQPFCDGAHKGTGIEPKEVKITESGKVPWCMCKHTKMSPWCDGAHVKLP